MYFDSVHAILVMDGHGTYVWAAYLVTLVVIIAALVIPVRRRRRLILQIAAEQRRARAGTGVRGGN